MLVVLVKLLDTLNATVQLVVLGKLLDTLNATI